MKIIFSASALILSGCIPAAQVGMEYVKATAVNTTYEMKKSEYKTSMPTNRNTKDVSDCVGNAFRNYAYDGHNLFGDTKVIQSKENGYYVISKTPYNPKLVTTTTDFNVNEILFLSEITQGNSGLNKIEIWYNPDVVFGGNEKIELAKQIIAPCV